MTDEQGEVQLPPMPLPGCAWCGEPSKGLIVARPARVGTSEGRARPVMAFEVPACQFHLENVEVQGDD